MQNYNISSTTTQRNQNDKVRVTATITSADGCQKMWFEILSEFSKFIDEEAVEPFVVALLAEVAKTGATIEVDSSVSALVLNNIRATIALLLNVHFYAGREIRVISGVRTTVGGTGVMTGFFAWRGYI